MSSRRGGSRPTPVGLQELVGIIGALHTTGTRLGDAVSDSMRVRVGAGKVAVALDPDALAETARMLITISKRLLTLVPNAGVNLSPGGKTPT